MNDPQQNYGINAQNDVIKSYDLIAIQPETEKMFQVACSNLDIDIISLDMTSRLGFPIKAGYVRQALDRGVVFEFCYGPLIADATARRNIVGNSRNIMRFGLNKGNGLIFTSGTDSAWQFRAPSDVINLAGLLGLPAHLRRAALEKNAEAVLLHAATRKHTFRAALAIIPAESDLDKTSHMHEDFIEFK